MVLKVSQGEKRETGLPQNLLEDLCGAAGAQRKEEDGAGAELTETAGAQGEKREIGEGVVALRTDERRRWLYESGERGSPGEPYPQARGGLYGLAGGLGHLLHLLPVPSPFSFFFFFLLQAVVLLFFRLVKHRWNFYFLTF